MQKSKKIENVNTQSQLVEIGALINDAKRGSESTGSHGKRKAPPRVKTNAGIEQRNAKDAEAARNLKKQKAANVLEKVSLYEQLSKERSAPDAYLVDFAAKGALDEYSDQDIYLALQEFYNKHSVTHLTHKDYQDLVEVVKAKGLAYLNEKLVEKYGDAVEIQPQQRAQQLLDTKIHTIQVEIVPSSRKLRREIIQKKLDAKRQAIQNLVT